MKRKREGETRSNRAITLSTNNLVPFVSTLACSALIQFARSQIVLKRKKPWNLGECEEANDRNLFWQRNLNNKEQDNIIIWTSSVLNVGLWIIGIIGIKSFRYIPWERYFSDGRIK